ncbi:MAG: hypothetical protein QM532_04140 [Cyanobium sp. MAG06]|nr:hypothetical protein [Cyanobium sp. MAG06]
MTKKMIYPIMVTLMAILEISIMLLFVRENNLAGVVFTGAITITAILLAIFLELLKIKDK